MSLTGTLDIALTVAENRVCDVRFSGLRALPLAALLHGKPAGEAPEIIGALFALCGHAQRACSAAAIEAALGVAAGPAEQTRRGRLVIAEALREHGMRIAVAWPELIGEQADMDCAALLHRGVRDYASGQAGAGKTLTDAVRRLVFGDGATLRGFDDVAGYEAWARAKATPAARLAARLLADAPGDAGDPEAGTPFGRRADHLVVAAALSAHGELAARVAARLIETLDLCDRLDADDCGSAVHSGADGAGYWAKTEVARGTLDHHVRLAEDGRIADYAIDAPTTANFSPGGPAEAAFRRLAGPSDDIAWRARLLALELDPCVEFSVRVL